MRDKRDSVSFRWYQRVWNDGDEKAIDEILHTEMIGHDLAPGLSQVGREDFKAFYADFKAEFTNIEVTVEEVVREDDVESARCSVKALHVKSGKVVSFNGISMSKIRGNKIVEAWNSFDFLTMNLQLGYALVAE